MSTDNQFAPAPFAPKGDVDFETVYSAVGHALNNWEHAENKFAHLFGTFVRPLRNSFAARRAYGSVTAASGRREMLESVAAVFFRNFPQDGIVTQFKTLMRRHQQAASRRNEMAHGIVGGEKGEDGTFLGYFVVPSMWNTGKRGLDSAMKYRYSTKEIDRLRAAFSTLGGEAIATADAVDEAFRSADKKLRDRW